MTGGSITWRPNSPTEEDARRNRNTTNRNSQEHRHQKTIARANTQKKKKKKKKKKNKRTRARTFEHPAEDAEGRETADDAKQASRRERANKQKQYDLQFTGSVLKKNAAYSQKANMSSQSHRIMEAGAPGNSATSQETAHVAKQHSRREHANEPIPASRFCNKWKSCTSLSACIV